MPNITVKLINFHLQPIWSSVNEDEIKIERNNTLTHRETGKLIFLWFHLSLNIGVWLLGCAAFALEMQRMQFASVSNTFAALISYNIKIKMHSDRIQKRKKLFLTDPLKSVKSVCLCCIWLYPINAYAHIKKDITIYLKN